MGGAGTSPMTTGQVESFQVAGVGGIPSTGVSSAVLVISAVNPVGDGALKLYPDGSSVPDTSSLLYSSGVNATNTDIVEVGSDGAIEVTNTYGTSTDVAVTIEGYFSTAAGTAGAGNFTPVTGLRLVDSRNATGYSPAGRVPAGTTVSVPVAGHNGLPAGISDVVLNLGAIGATGAGTFKAWPGGKSAPSYAVSSFDSNGSSSSLTTVPVGSDGTVNVSVVGADTNLLVDVQGYFMPSSSDSPPSFVEDNSRMLDTRGGAALAPGETRALNVLPLQVQGQPTAALHVGVPDATSGGGLRIWPDGTTMPTFNQMNYATGESSSLEFAQLGADGYVDVKNTGSAPVDLVVDIQGWFPDNSDSSSSLGVVAEGNGWVDYTDSVASSLSLQGATTSTVDGTVTADGDCEFTASGTGDSSSSDNYQEETAYDPQTCQERVLSGSLTTADEQALDQQTSDAATYDNSGDTANALRSGTDAAGSDTATSYGDSPDALSATTYYAGAHIKTSWIDPLKITITSLSDNMRWPLYGKAGTLSAKVVPYEFRWDGWSSSGITPIAFQGITGGWKVPEADHFTNHDFADFVYAVFGLSGWALCGAHTSDQADFYHSESISGYRNDSYSWSYDDHKSGACANLVHHNHWGGWGWRN